MVLLQTEGEPEEDPVEMEDPVGNSSGNLLISAEGMVSGTNYTIKSGSSSTTATAK